MEHIAQGKRSDTLGFPHSRVSAPCKGKSFNPLCCYFYLIADLAVLKRNIVCIFCSTPAPCLKAFALTGRDYSNTRYPGCRFACPGLGAFGLSGRSRTNPKLELHTNHTQPIITLKVSKCTPQTISGLNSGELQTSSLFVPSNGVY